MLALLTKDGKFDFVDYLYSGNLCHQQLMQAVSLQNHFSGSVRLSLNENSLSGFVSRLGLLPQRLKLENLMVGDVFVGIDSNKIPIAGQRCTVAFGTDLEPGYLKLTVDINPDDPEPYFYWEDRPCSSRDFGENSVIFSLNKYPMSSAMQINIVRADHPKLLTWEE